MFLPLLYDDANNHDKVNQELSLITSSVQFQFSSNSMYCCNMTVNKKISIFIAVVAVAVLVTVTDLVSARGSV